MNGGIDDLVVTRWGARFQGQKFPCAIGRGGIAEKQGEGDGITPRGIWSLDEIWYRPDRVSFNSPQLPAHPIGPTDVWSDDPADPGYNLHDGSGAHPFSHERLRRSDPLYDVFGVLNYNWPNPVSGAGSAIFLHIWRKPRHPTEGCVAFDRKIFFHILANWTERSRVIIR